MKKTSLIALLLCTLLVTIGSARTWTDVQNRKIEAELLRVEGEKVILKFKGKEVKFALTKLCEEDQEYIKEWQEEQEENTDEDAASSTDVGEITVCGTALKPDGALTTVEEPVNQEVAKAYAKAADKPAKIKIAIGLPKGFDPSIPQRAIWISAPINSENQRKSGNISALRSFAKTATDAGWVVLSADLDIGNPRRPEGDRSEDGELAVHTQAIEALTAAWPTFKTWEFACGGGSGGAKVSFFRVGNLLNNKLNVIGLYLVGCNQDTTESARKLNKYRKSDLRKVNVWISNGDKDKVSTVAHAEAIRQSIKSNRYGKIRLELFDGGHTISQEEFKKALEWFLEVKG